MGWTKLTRRIDPDLSIEEEEKLIQEEAERIAAAEDAIISHAAGHYKNQLSSEAEMQERMRKHWIALRAHDELSAFQQIQEEQRAASNPPARALDLLVLFTSNDDLLGCLTEDFAQNRERFGDRVARRLCWLQVFRSIVPIIAERLSKWGFFATVLEYSRRKLGL